MKTTRNTARAARLNPIKQPAAFWPKKAEKLFQQYDLHGRLQAGSEMKFTTAGRAFLSICWSIFCLQQDLRGSVSFETDIDGGNERACLRLHADNAPLDVLEGAYAYLSDVDGDQWLADVGFMDVLILDTSEGVTFAALLPGSVGPLLATAQDLGSLLSEMLPSDCSGMAAWALSGRKGAANARY